MFIICTFDRVSKLLKLLSIHFPPKLLMKSIHSAQESRYRSVKYRLNRNISIPPVNEISVDKRVYMPKTTKNSFVRPKRNSAKFSVSHIENFKGSYTKGQFEQQQKLKGSTYIDTFHFMLSMEKNRYNAKEKEKQELDQLEKQRINNPELVSKNSRVFLPTLNQLDSHFTVLDNIHLPIKYINEQIERLNKEIFVEHQNMKKIGVQIKQIEKKNIKKIQQIQQIGLVGFAKLRNLIKSNMVYQQQQALKHKHALERCRSYLPEYKKSFEESKQKVKDLQDTIFKGTPFELEQERQFQLISTKYF